MSYGPWRYLLDRALDALVLTGFGESKVFGDLSEGGWMIEGSTTFFAKRKCWTLRSAMPVGTAETK
jgi:hypothetical protein